MKIFFKLENITPQIISRFYHYFMHELKFLFLLINLTKFVWVTLNWFFFSSKNRKKNSSNLICWKYVLFIKLIFPLRFSPFGSVRDSCGKRVLTKLNDWIGKQTVGRNSFPSFNVFIADFVDLEEDKFTKTVINLNFNSLTEITEVQ